MERSRLNLFARLVAFWTLLLVLTGAAVTSTSNPAKPQLARLALFENIHTAVAIVEAFLAIVLSIWISRTDKRPWAIRFGWISLSVAVIESGLGEGWLGPHAHGSTPGIGTLHACLAALVFVAFAAIAQFSSPAWQREPDQVQDYGWPSLRFLSSAAALLVAMQVGFGAAFRHDLTGVMWHLLGALVVALFIMIVGAFVSNQFPKHATLRPMAVALMVITGIQVFLGMTAFLMRMMDVAGSTAWLVISVAHVGVGSLTFAASAVLAIEVRRSVLPRAPKAS
jgi:hypothetical protein